MTSSEQTRINQLRSLIRKYDAAYYGRGESLISDKEYDGLYNELVELEKKNPAYIISDSPTQRIGNDLTKEFAKVEHSVPMMSIENTYSAEELSQWIQRTKKNIGPYIIEFIGELKLDGVACAIRYNNGKLVQAITRGSGTTGDDITVNVRTIRSLPLSVDLKEPFEIRGEIYMTFNNFRILNEKLIEEGMNPMQNPRNTSAGTVKLLDPKEVAKRNLSFSAHFLLSKSYSRKHYNNLSLLGELGIPTVIHSKPLFSFEDIMNFCNEWKDKKNDLSFPVDGVVVKVNDFKLQEKLGTTAKSPRWIIAYKYEAETANTILKNVEFQVGRTGVITPVAKLEPVSLAGVTIENATLHNEDYINNKNILIGDTVTIERAGEVIPAVIGPVIQNRNGDENKILFPKVCPVCEHKLLREDKREIIGKILSLAKNSKTKEEKKKRDIRLIIELGIDGVGEENAKILRNNFDSLSSIFSAPPEKIKEIIGGNERSKKIANSLRLFQLDEVKNKYRQWILGKGIKPQEPLQHSKKSLQHEDIALRCQNFSCPAQIRERIIYFISKNAMNIEGFGEKMVDAFIKEGIITDAADIYKLTYDDIFGEGGLKEKGANNLIRAINKSKNIPLSKFLFALGIRNVGEQTAKQISFKFKSIEEIMVANEFDFIEKKQISDVGFATAINIVSFFSDSSNRDLIHRLLKNGVAPYVEQKKDVKTELSNKTFIFTGRLEKFSRNNAKKYVEELGGNVGSSISNKTDYLVVGENAGEKLVKAKKMNVPILTETEFLKLIGKK